MSVESKLDEIDLTLRRIADSVEALAKSAQNVAYVLDVHNCGKLPTQFLDDVYAWFGAIRDAIQDIGTDITDTGKSR